MMNSIYFLKCFPIFSCNLSNDVLTYILSNLSYDSIFLIILHSALPKHFFLVDKLALLMFTFNIIILSQMVLIQLGGLALCIPANLLASYMGHHCKRAEDRDIFLGSTTLFFTFYPLIISLPQAHFKLIKYTIEQNQSQTAIQQDDIFPFAFLICLLSITACIFFDKFLIKSCNTEQLEQDKTKQIFLNPNGLKFFLSLSIAIQNIVNYYYICIQENQTQIAKEIFLFILYSLLINFSYAYLLSEAEIDKKAITHFVLYMNAGLITGFLLSLFLPPDILLLTLPCFCAGIQLYCSIFLCFPAIFSDGQNNNQDRDRYCSIFIVFMFVLIYYPICYSLRI